MYDLDQVTSLTYVVLFFHVSPYHWNIRGHMVVYRISLGICSCALRSAYRPSQRVADTTSMLYVVSLSLAPAHARNKSAMDDAGKAERS